MSKGAMVYYLSRTRIKFGHPLICKFSRIHPVYEKQKEPLKENEVVIIIKYTFNTHIVRDIKK